MLQVRVSRHASALQRVHARIRHVRKHSLGARSSPFNILWPESCAVLCVDVEGSRIAMERLVANELLDGGFKNSGLSAAVVSERRRELRPNSANVRLVHA